MINSRTILTAAHCFAPNESVSISFAPIAGPGTAITSFVRNSNFPGNVAFAPNDIAVISLAQPITTISPVTIGGLVPAPGTVLVSAGYGANGIGTNCCNPIDDKRRNMTIEFRRLRARGGCERVHVGDARSVRRWARGRWRRLRPRNPVRTRSRAAARGHRARLFEGAAHARL